MRSNRLPNGMGSMRGTTLAKIGCGRPAEEKKAVILVRSFRNHISRRDLRLQRGDSHTRKVCFKVKPGQMNNDNKPHSALIDCSADTVLLGKFAMEASHASDRKHRFELCGTSPVVSQSSHRPIHSASLRPDRMAMRGIGSSLP